MLCHVYMHPKLHLADVSFLFPIFIKVYMRRVYFLVIYRVTIDLKLHLVDVSFLFLIFIKVYMRRVYFLVIYRVTIETSQNDNHNDNIKVNSILFASKAVTTFLFQ